MSLVISANTTEEGAGTLQDDLVEEKRHSRSLDLGPNARMRLHQRSASESDGIDFIAASEQKISPSVVASAVPTAKEETTSHSVFSLYKKLGSPRRNRSLSSNTKGFTSKSRASIGSAFSSFRQPSLSTISTTTTNTTTTTTTNINNKNRFSAPVNNPGMLFILFNYYYLY